MNCPATQFINTIEQQAESMTVHRHPDNSTWVHAKGTDAQGKTHYFWTHIISKQKHENYPCCKHGWVNESLKPNAGTKVIVVDVEGEQSTDEWYKCPECQNESWLFADDDITHWMPQSQLPEAKG